MNFLAPLEHFDKLDDFPNPGLCLLHRLNSKQDRISVRTIQRLKEFSSSRTGVESRLKILRDLR
jgi:hypothetical protein